MESATIGPHRVLHACCRASDFGMLSLPANASEGRDQFPTAARIIERCVQPFVAPRRRSEVAPVPIIVSRTARLRVSGDGNIQLPLC